VAGCYTNLIIFNLIEAVLVVYLYAEEAACHPDRNKKLFS
jgi:hypothetical protein